MILLTLFFILVVAALLSLILLIIPLILIAVGTLSFGAASISNGASKGRLKGVKVFIYTFTGLIGLLIGAFSSYFIQIILGSDSFHFFSSENLPQILIWAGVGCGFGLLIGKLIHWIYGLILKLVRKIKERHSRDS